MNPDILIEQRERGASRNDSSWDIDGMKAMRGNSSYNFYFNNLLRRIYGDTIGTFEDLFAIFGYNLDILDVMGGAYAFGPDHYRSAVGVRLKNIDQQLISEYPEDDMLQKIVNNPSRHIIEMNTYGSWEPLHNLMTGKVNASIGIEHFRIAIWRPVAGQDRAQREIDAQAQLYVINNILSVLDPNKGTLLANDKLGVYLPQLIDANCNNQHIRFQRDEINWHYSITKHEEGAQLINPWE